MLIKITALITTRGATNTFTRQGNPVYINSEHIILFQTENKDSVVYLVDGTRIIVQENPMDIAATIGFQVV
ncbi:MULTISPECIES: flagellar FlbD family protein [Enterobacteriaceae]|uniref:flagellar FlbD family protein n=1 Tax=Enterobacteriaceae TaxID=543 RepID=UPI0015E9EE10|nr:MULTISPECIES: flagellar FlbD family protein [Enterobacteriaceae]MCU8695861.1 flagellar FlbD family protein [Enterobacter cloacae]QMN72156.1 flagellar FlbD family protein [Citrobacter freundii]HBM2776606.1 flagellar FlbD family protein [Enterobacter hormaechei subsp. xiangfangensis]